MLGDPPALIRTAVLCWIGAVVVWWIQFFNNIAWTSTIRPDLEIDLTGTMVSVLVSAAVVVLALVVRSGLGWARYMLAAVGVLIGLAWLFPGLAAVLAAAAGGAPAGLVLTMGVLRLAIIVLVAFGTYLMFWARSTWYFA